MKPGDWIEYKDERYIVIAAYDVWLRAITERGSPFQFRVKDVKHLPDCTGWDWEPEPQWRGADNEDVVRALRGETVDARFRDQDEGHFTYGKLTAIYPFSQFPWINEQGAQYKFCEVRA